MEQYELLILAGLCVSFYLLGSIPTGVILAKLMNLGDLRSIGSGSTGATNVLRTGNKVAALLTLVIDTSKGAAAVVLAMAFIGTEHHHFLMVAGLLAVIGHCFPLWLKFNGGKGVATALGVLLTATPLTGLMCLSLWLGTFFSKRISSLSALIACAAAPVITYSLYGDAAMLVTFLLSGLIIWRHQDNIRRLIRGEEKAFTAQKEE